MFKNMCGSCFGENDYGSTDPLEYEQWMDCGLILDIVLNLDYYDFDIYCVSRTEYLKAKFCKGGINIFDQAFAFLLLMGIGDERQRYTDYVSINQNEQTFIMVSVEPDYEIAMQQ